MIVAFLLLPYLPPLNTSPTSDIKYSSVIGLALSSNLHMFIGMAVGPCLPILLLNIGDHIQIPFLRILKRIPVAAAAGIPFK